MKYASQQSDRLAQAYKEIDELKKENSRLQKELFNFRTKKLNENIPPTSLPRNTPTGTTNSNHFAQSTVASRNKDTPKSQSSSGSQGKTPRAVVTIGENNYIYKGGVPVHADYKEFWKRPHFMYQKTRASYAREGVILRERNERRNRQIEIEERRVSKKLSSSSISEPNEVSSWGPCDPEWANWEEKDKDEEKDEEGEEDEKNEEEDDDDEEEDKEDDDEEEDDDDEEKKEERRILEIYSGRPPFPFDDLAIRSRLHRESEFERRWLGIDSKSGFDYLRKGYEIAQAVVYKVGNSGHPGWYRFEDGPHIVKLGRDELLSWMHEHPFPEFGYNGYSAYSVRDALLDLVHLRNAISHPWTSTFRSPQQVDRHLKDVQKVAIMLRDEQRAFEVRKLRDELSDMAKRSVQEIQDLYYLTSQPYSPEIKYHHHHVVIFRGLIENGPSLDEEAFAVAEAWARQGGRVRW
ncbi:hypothetical protein F4825DRAFT_473037 [Nemania diffusa]|nr:hypothetical protein F4825DRAFT_473037 [Nemania diffusa]